MKIQLASDLHLEFLRRFPGERLITPAPGADVLILAGDISNGTDGCVPVLPHASRASLTVHVRAFHKAMHRSHLTAEHPDERTRGC
jgi:hypothetical protein